MSNENKKYYWIKLKTDFFSQATIDFLLSQKNGCEYIVLYQMLCLNTANNNGEMATKIGEMIIPYDVEKIVRDTKYFDFDTVTIALGLFKKLGLIYEEENQILKIANFGEMVGSETQWAEKKRIYRENKKLLNEGQSKGQSKGQKKDNVRQENRDKSLEIRDESIEIDDNNILSSAYSEIISYLNQKTGKRYKSTIPKTQTLIKARMKEDFTIDDFKTVIDNKCAEWLGDSKMEKFLRPETLFGTKFESYLNSNSRLTNNQTGVNKPQSEHDRFMGELIAMYNESEE